jgi:hypothetical protein
MGQNSGQKMKSFIPKNNAYDIYYPENFNIEENEEGIVSIYDEKNKINITVSAHAFDKELDANSIFNLMNDYFTDYFSMQLKHSDFKEYKTSFDNLIKCEFKEKDNYWMWWAISKKDKLIIISLNKTEKISIENINLLRFMINKLIIN